MPHWLIAVSWATIILGLLTAGAVIADLTRHPQRMKIMNVVWPVTGLYLPVAAWGIYAAMGRPMAVDRSEAKTEQPRWKSVFLSSTHCGSGCVLGDIIAAPVVAAAGLTLFGEHLFAEYAVEFGFAYVFGIAFQYFPILAMRKLAPGEALRDAVKADTLSLIAFQVGMYAWMAIPYFVFFPTDRPTPSSAVFWLMMQIGMVLGLATTYPANWMLVKWGVKTGM